MPKESKNAKKERISQIISILQAEQKGEFEGLNHTSAFELLIATILSAQCTDARVNIVTLTLFPKYKYPIDYVNVPIEELEQDIKSTGFYKAKAKNIKECCRRLVEVYGGHVPNKLDDLITLAGVGRKTANVVLSHCFGKQAITVDTHVTRIANLLGFVKTEDAVKIEHELMSFVPEDLWNEVNYRFITHGRKVCIARRPQCAECNIRHLCPSNGVVGK
jgi:endonuclease III